MAPRRNTLETTVEAAACVLLERDYGCICVKAGYRGWPDRLVLLGGGRHLWLEFKRPGGGSLTPAQRRVIPMLVGPHAETVVCVRSVAQAVNAVQEERRKP